MSPVEVSLGNHSLSTPLPLWEGSGEGLLFLVALSGGADSVCLLLAMKRLGYTIEAVLQASGQLAPLNRKKPNG